MKTETLQDLLVLKIKALYDIETMLVKALPEMVRASYDKELKQAFRDHLKETRMHVVRLQQVFKHMGYKPSKTVVDAIRGLVLDAEWVIENIQYSSARDAALIGAARYVEHYEQAGYMVSHAWAKKLGLEEVADLLNETLTEEKNADSLLAKIGKEIDKVLV